MVERLLSESLCMTVLDVRSDEHCWPPTTPLIDKRYGVQKEFGSVIGKGIEETGGGLMQLHGVNTCMNTRMRNLGRLG